jgi:hypothetical protein
MVPIRLEIIESKSALRGILDQAADGIRGIDSTINSDSQIMMFQ